MAGRTRGLALHRANRLATVLLACLALCLGACHDSEWDQSTPEATIATARRAVEKGRASQLSRLVYPETPEMNELLRKLGVLLGNLQKLATQINASFPGEVAKLKERAAKSVESGEAAGVLGQIAQEATGGARRRRGPTGGNAPNFEGEEKRQRVLQDALESLFADPYAYLRESEKRLTAAYATDDMVSLRWDDKPILPPIGLQLKRGTDGKWYFKLPTGLPGFSQVLPKTAREWRIAEYAVVVVNNTIVDLRKDIEAKRITSIEQLSQAAGEKTVPPMILIFAAYSKAMEERKKAGGS